MHARPSASQPLLQTRASECRAAHPPRPRRRTFPSVYRCRAKRAARRHHPLRIRADWCGECSGWIGPKRGRLAKLRCERIVVGRRPQTFEFIAPSGILECPLRARPSQCQLQRLGMPKAGRWMPLSIVEEEHDRIAVSSPYHAHFPVRARSLGGVWNAARRVWVFDAGDHDRVRSLFCEITAEAGWKMAKTGPRRSPWAITATGTGSPKDIKGTLRG